MTTQATREICRQCGGEVTITPTVSPWNFEAVCKCGHWLISWAHRDAPPAFVRELRQGVLFP